MSRLSQPIAYIGANALVAGATIGLDNNAFYANNTAVNAVAGSQFVSAGNNKFNSNADNGANPSSSMVIHEVRVAGRLL